MITTDNQLEEKIDSLCDCQNRLTVSDTNDQVKDEPAKADDEAAEKDLWSPTHCHPEAAIVLRTSDGYRCLIPFDTLCSER